MAIDYESIGKRIKSYRTSRGLSQETFGEMIFVNNLKCIRDGKNRTRPGLRIDSIYKYDIDNVGQRDLRSEASGHLWRARLIRAAA